MAHRRRLRRRRRRVHAQCRRVHRAGACVVRNGDEMRVADGAARDVLTASPPFAPQVAKALPDRGWLSVSEISAARKR